MRSSGQGHECVLATSWLCAAAGSVKVAGSGGVQRGQVALLEGEDDGIELGQAEGERSRRRQPTQKEKETQARLVMLGRSSASRLSQEGKGKKWPEWEGKTEKGKVGLVGGEDRWASPQRK